MRKLGRYRSRLPLSLEVMDRRDLPSAAAVHYVPTYAPPAFDESGLGLVGARSRVSDRLLDLYNTVHRGRGAIPADSPLTFDADGAPLVRITAAHVDSLRERLVVAGFRVTGSAPAQGLIEGFAPLAALPALEACADGGLLGVGGIIQGGFKGSVTSEADFVHQSDRVRTNYSFNGYVNGESVRIGILSDSFDSSTATLTNFVDDVASGDLPPFITIQKEGIAAASDEGRAMAQLIRDVSPGSWMAFASAMYGEADFAQQARDLAHPLKGNCKVITDNWFVFTDPFYQTGLIRSAIEANFADGVVHTSAIGNSGAQGWEGVGIGTTLDPLYGTAIDFDPGAGVDSRMRFTVAAGGQLLLNLQWSQPFYTLAGVTSDLDLRLIRVSDGKLMDSDLDNDIAAQTPQADINFVNSSGASQQYDLIITRAAGATPGRIKLVSYRTAGVTPQEWMGATSTANAHAAIPEAGGTAAVDWMTPEGFQPTSSVGGGVTLFSLAGLPLATPVVEPGPLFAAVDGTNTTFFGFDRGGDTDTLPNFFGTSAAAAHAAGLAALVRDSDSSLSPAQVLARLQNAADPRGNPADRVGAGLINAYTAVYGAPSTRIVEFNDPFQGSGEVGPEWEVRTFGPGQVLRTTDYGPDGSQHVVLGAAVHAAASAPPSRSELTLRANLDGADNVLLSFRAKSVGDEPHSMPATFADGHNSDGVALSVDGGVNWVRLVNLGAAAMPTIYTTYTVNLSEVAAAQGLKLGKNSRVRFQQYDDAKIGDDGIAFDNISLSYKGSVAGTSFSDTDADGVQDMGEPGNPGRVIFLDANNNGELDFTPALVATTGQLPAPIGDLRKTVYPLVVSGAGGTIADANVNLSLAHTYAADLDITLIHPDGTRVMLSSDNGGSGDDYTATIFDDEAAPAIAAGTAPFTGRFRPESPLSALDGRVLNGTWQLEIVDDSGGDAGLLLDWSLQLANTSKNVANKAIPDNGTLFSSLAFAGQTGTLSDLDITVNINHPFAADLDIALQAPNGTIINLSDDNGGSGDDYVNTIFDDDAAVTIIGASAPFTGRFRPEAKLSAFDGLPINGAWTLIVADDAANDAGTLIDWSMTYGRTFTPAPAKALADFATTTSTITVPDLGFVTDLDVTLNIEHAFLADVDVYLTDPGGMKVALTTDNGGAVAGLYNQTRFDDEATLLVTAGATPFAGRYRPEEALSKFDRRATAGAWTLTVVDDAGGDVGSLLGWSLDFAAGKTFSSVNVPLDLTGQATPVGSLLNVSGLNGSISDINVTFSATHEWNSVIDVYLIAPSGLSVELFSSVGGNSQNFSATVLDDEAVTAITDGSGPFTGKYRPEGRLDQFDGLNPNGIWTLRVHNDSFVNDGVLTGWSLDITTGERFTTTNAAGDYQFSDLAPGTVRVREQLPAGVRWTAPVSGLHTVANAYSSATGDLDFGSLADAAAPTAKFTAVAPDPRNSPVPAISVTFSEPVTGVSIDDFSLSRNGAPVPLAGATLTTADNITYTLGNLGSLTAAGGGYVISLTGLGSGIVDAADNAFTGAITDAWTTDLTAPQVVSVARLDPNPTAAASVSWLVTFSEPVSGLSPTNFSLFGAGAIGAAITGITGGGATYTVTASTFGDGPLGLKVVSSAGVSDPAGNALAGLPFSGEVYTVNKPDIRVEAVIVGDGSAQRSTVRQLAVRFDQIVSFAGAPEAAFALARTPDNTLVNFTAAVDNSSGRTVVTLSGFTGPATEFGSLADGYYQVVVLAHQVFSSNGALDGNGDGFSGDYYFSPLGPAAGAIHRLFGDADGNRTVNAADFLAFRLAFLSANDAFDFDNDGTVGSGDFLTFKLRFLGTI